MNKETWHTFKVTFQTKDGASAFGAAWEQVVTNVNNDFYTFEWKAPVAKKPYALISWPHERKIPQDVEKDISRAFTYQNVDAEIKVEKLEVELWRK